MSEHAERRARHTRFSWFRLFNDFTRHPKWRLIARRAKVELRDAAMVALDLMCTANAARPRGSVAEWDPDECGAALDLDGEAVARVYLELERSGWIDQEHIVTWYERQPDIEDATAKERQRRRRERLREQREKPSEGLWTRVTRDNRDITTRSDQIKKEGPAEERASEQAPVVHTNSGDYGEDRGNAELWLAHEGRRIVTQRANVLGTVAQYKLAKWQRSMGNDVLALADLIAAVDAQNLRGDAFQRAIEGGITRYVRERDCGPSLRLPPVKTGGRHG